MYQQAATQKVILLVTSAGYVPLLGKRKKIANSYKQHRQLNKWLIYLSIYKTSKNINPPSQLDIIKKYNKISQLKSKQKFRCNDNKVVTEKEITVRHWYRNIIHLTDPSANWPEAKINWSIDFIICEKTTALIHLFPHVSTFQPTGLYVVCIWDLPDCVMLVFDVNATTNTSITLIFA